MEQWQRDRLDSLERAGYIPTFRRLAMSHTCPFFWSQGIPADGTAVLHNGTATFVDTGTRVLTITADHVYRQYLADKESRPDIECQIGNVTIEPENHAIECDQILDLAVFELPATLRAATGAIPHTLRTWPPKPLTQSELTLLGGYPGNRREEGPGALHTDFVTFISPVAQSSESHMSFQLNLAESHWPAGVSVGTAPDLGGMSGGPVFRFCADPIERLEFAGVVYQAHTEYEIVRGRQAVHIRADGTLCR